MAETNWGDDDALLAALDDALRAARDVPPSFLDAAGAAYAWRAVDAELAALSFDSHTAGRVVATARSEQAPLRALTFVSARLRLHLEVLRDALHGQVVPPQGGEVELCPATGPFRVAEVDEVGWFVLRPLPVGTFRLRCRTHDGTTVLTDWITL